MNAQCKQRFALLALIGLCLPLSSSGYVGADIRHDWYHAESSDHDRGVLLEARLDDSVPLQTLKNNNAICPLVGITVSTRNAKSCSHLLANTESTAVTRLPKFDVERGKGFFPAKASKPIFEIKPSVKDGADHSIALGEADNMLPLPDLAAANSGVWRVINLHSEECLTQLFTDEKDRAKIGQNGCRLESVKKTLSSQHL